MYQHLTNLNDSNMTLCLERKNVLITGTSRVIGVAITSVFPQEDMNTCIVFEDSDQLNQIDSKLQISFSRGRVFIGQCDCTNPNSPTLSLDRLTDGAIVLVECGCAAW